MINHLPLPHDWSADQALAFAEFLYEIADELLRLYDGPIRIYYRELNEMRQQKRDTRQLDLPFTPYPDDFPF